MPALRRNHTLWLLWLLCALPLWAEQQSVDILLNNPITRNANIGIYIRNARTGEVIESYRSKNLIPPASTIKLLTTATALEMLGSDYRFSTFIEYSGSLQDGTLHGDLYVRGQGDPTLGSRYDKTTRDLLGRWTKAIRQAGIQRIEGHIIADLSFYDGEALNPGWLCEDAGNYYAPGIFALSYLDNTMNIILRSGKEGEVAEVTGTSPKVEGLVFENHIRCTKTEEDGAYVYGLPCNNFRYLTGSVPSNRGSFGIKGDLPNPGLLLAQHLTDRLRKEGISVRNEAIYRSEADLIPRHLIYEHRSDSLGAIVAHTNLHSINLFAEMIYRNLAARISVPCTINHSEQVVRHYWRSRGVNLSSAILKDGCGLAPQDAVSAEQFVQLLTYMDQSSEREAFYASLPISGKTGTLCSLLAQTELEGRVHAKSGTIAGTKNFAGYIELPNGERWVFAVLVNSASGKARQVQPIIAKYLLDVYRRNR